MTNREWTVCIGGLLDAVERELPSVTPGEDRAALGAMRNRIVKKRRTEARKPYEREVDELIGSRPSLLEAAHRHIGKIAPPALAQATVLLKRAGNLLDREPDTTLKPAATKRIRPLRRGPA